MCYWETELQTEFIEEEYRANKFVEEVARVSGWIVAKTQNELLLCNTKYNVVTAQYCWQDLRTWILNNRI